jgi:hypothetical protein
MSVLSPWICQQIELLGIERLKDELVSLGENPEDDLPASAWSSACAATRSRGLGIYCRRR